MYLIAKALHWMFAGLVAEVTSVVSISPLSNPKRNKFG
jgi:hypothetical protein